MFATNMFRAMKNVSTFGRNGKQGTADSEVRRLSLARIPKLKAAVDFQLAQLATWRTNSHPSRCHESVERDVGSTRPAVHPKPRQLYLLLRPHPWLFDVMAHRM